LVRTREGAFIYRSDTGHRKWQTGGIIWLDRQSLILYPR
jgi:hypothetical protein